MFTKDRSAAIAATLWLGLLPGILITSSVAEEPAPTLTYQVGSDEEISEEDLAGYNGFLAELSPVTGEIDLTIANATLNIPVTHYFLKAVDARKVLEDAWGNPPDETVLGMIFPAGLSPFNAPWGATVQYNDDGYISDEDAGTIDYGAMMSDLKSSQVAENEWRTENGYEEIEMIGWAESPSYDNASHKLYWAKEMRFGEADNNTLNYDIRVLGRRGALVVSFIATMDELAAIQQSTPAVLNMASFNAGSTYSDYEPGVDKKAAYGIAGLIGGAAIAKKTGLLAAILLFGKKFIVFIIAGIAAGFGALRKFFAKN
ncbi:MAG: DUF2167 domain-containing protein [Pseudomonadota bacterium]